MASQASPFPEGLRPWQPTVEATFPDYSDARAADPLRLGFRSLAVGISDSLKNVEHIYMPKREDEVATASEATVYYHRWLEAPDGKTWQDSPTLRLIRDYNKVDCDSTWELSKWLRQQQTIAGRSYAAPKPPTEVAETTSGRAALAQEMLVAIPKEIAAAQERWRVHALLAHLLEYHRREHKSRYWAMFERAEMTEQELIEDSECLGGGSEDRCDSRSGETIIPL